MTPKQIERGFLKLKDDKQRWRYVVAHRESVTILLDNDETYASFNGTEEWCAFDWYIGNGPGCEVTLESMGLKAEGV